VQRYLQNFCCESENLATLSKLCIPTSPVPKRTTKYPALDLALARAFALALPLTASLLINNHSLRQEYAVISVLARLDVVLQEDSLVMLFVDHNTKRAVAKCSRAGCDRGAQRLKIRANTQSYCSLTCHHVDGVWDFLSNGQYSKFVISECSHQQLRCILLCNMMLCRHEQRALLSS
jgi:hypothetical protein